LLSVVIRENNSIEGSARRVSKSSGVFPVVWGGQRPASPVATTYSIVKAQLALEYAYRYASEYEGVWWFHAEESLTLALDYVDLAPALGVSVVEDQGKPVRNVHGVEPVE
jgi:hypothetical protein